MGLPYKQRQTMTKDTKNLIKDQDPREEKIRILEEHFPGAVERDEETGGYNLNADILRRILDPAKTKEVEDGYELRWVGKKYAYHDAYVSNRKLLKPLYDDSVDFDSTGNILIKGDNLDALKILRQNYRGKIKMIYIDPPYNTQSDEFIYKDKFTDSDEEILTKLDYPEEDKDYIKNLLGSKRHSGWLSFMYSRLLLAKDLLRDDGVIFISIDENENAQLRIICDEIFNAQNYVNNFAWISNLKGRQISNFGSAKTWENVLVYAKESELIERWFIEISEAKKLSDSYKPKDYEVMKDEKGEYVIKNALHNTNSAFNEETRSKLSFTIHYNPDNQDIRFSDIHENKEYGGYISILPPKNKSGSYQAWRWSQEKIKKDKEDLYFSVDNSTCTIYTKIRNFKITRFKDLITNISNGGTELNNLGMSNCFDTAKPVKLINLLVRTVTADFNETDEEEPTPISEENESDDNDIVLDFFAGSGTTAQAVMEMNKEDGGNRKFILVQKAEEIPSTTDKEKKKHKAKLDFLRSINRPLNIFELCAERVRRAGASIKSKEVDTGFKTFEVIEDSANKIYDIPLSDIKQQKDWVGMQSKKIDELLYSFMAADGIMLDEDIESVIRDKLYIVSNIAYIFAEIDLEELKRIKDDYPQVDYLTLYSPNITSDEFMLKFEDRALALGFDKNKIKTLG